MSSSSKHTVTTDFGKITYTGELSEKTMLTMPDRKKITFYSLLSLTNGACREWFNPEPKIKE